MPQFKLCPSNFRSLRLINLIRSRLLENLKRAWVFLQWQALKNNHHMSLAPPIRRTAQSPNPATPTVRFWKEKASAINSDQNSLTLIKTQDWVKRMKIASVRRGKVKESYQFWTRNMLEGAKQLPLDLKSQYCQSENGQWELHATFSELRHVNPKVREDSAWRYLSRKRSSVTTSQTKMTQIKTPDHLPTRNWTHFSRLAMKEDKPRKTTKSMELCQLWQSFIQTVEKEMNQSTLVILST